MGPPLRPPLVAPPVRRAGAARPRLRRRRPPAIALALAWILALTACASTTRPPEGAPLRLDADLSPLKAWFDAHRDVPRAVALLSPT